MLDPLRAKQAIALLDLTSLEAGDDAAKIDALCAKAMTPFGPVAAVCLWPRFVARARATLAGSGIAIAAVANFPHGAGLVAPVEAEIDTILAAGGDEIDLVFPYNAWLNGEHRLALDLVAAARRRSEGRKLKLILETGLLRDAETIGEVARAAIAAGVDFIKTSTGKSAVSATPMAARIMLAAIREAGGTCGFKAAGGLRDPASLALYLDLAAQTLGADWIAPTHFRFGASSVLGRLIDCAAGRSSAEPSHGY